MLTPIRRHRLLLAGALAAALLSACAVTKKARNVRTTMFLEDYSRLEPGEGEYEANLRWVNPNARWASYDKILLDPILVWRGEKARSKNLSEKEAQALVNDFYTLLYTSLDQDYEMVQTIEPGTLRVRVAITSAKDTSQAFDLASTVSPIGIGISTLSDVVTGKPGFVGEATVEARVTDAVTGESLFECVARQVGGKNVTKGLGDWVDARNAMQMWAALARYRLCVLRGDDCEPPPTDAALLPSWTG